MTVQSAHAGVDNFEQNAQQKESAMSDNKSEATYGSREQYRREFEAAQVEQSDETMPAFAEAVLVDERPEFLPLAVRRVLYVLSLAGSVAAPVLAVTSPEYAAAIVTGAGILNAAALGTALANPSR